MEQADGREFRGTFPMRQGGIPADEYSREGEDHQYVFRNSLQKIGLDQGRQVIGNMNFSQPTPHSLRHAFAVNTLIRIKKKGQSPQRALPVLAAYMGHSEYKYTSVYLKVADAQSRKNLVDFSLWQKSKE